MSDFAQNHPNLTAAFAAVTAVATVAGACVVGNAFNIVAQASVLSDALAVGTRIGAEAFVIAGGIAAIHKLGKAAFGF